MVKIKDQTDQLLIEDAYELETSIETDINESTGVSTKNYYIHGTFSTPDKKNRNGRTYSTKLWENAIQGWKDKVKSDNKYRLGEMEHPTRVDPDPMKAVIKITSLKLDEGVVKGRAKILNNNSEVTNQMKALIDEGIKIGVSSRGTGRMKGSIVEEFNLSTYDVVQSPSDYNAMLSGIVESTEVGVVLNEATGKMVCTKDGCSLDTPEIEETKCSKNAYELIKNLQEFTKPVSVLSEKDKKVIEIVGKTTQKIREARQYNGKEILKQFDTAIDAMDELIYRVGQSDQETESRMVEALEEIEQLFHGAGFTNKWKPTNEGRLQDDHTPRKIKEVK